jgi:hypothetical protein
MQMTVLKYNDEFREREHIHYEDASIKYTLQELIRDLRTMINKYKVIDLDLQSADTTVTDIQSFAKAKLRTLKKKHKKAKGGWSYTQTSANYIIPALLIGLPVHQYVGLIGAIKTAGGTGGLVGSLHHIWNKFTRESVATKYEDQQQKIKPILPLFDLLRGGIQELIVGGEKMIESLEKLCTNVEILNKSQLQIEFIEIVLMHTRTMKVHNDNLMKHHKSNANANGLIKSNTG